MVCRPAFLALALAALLEGCFFAEGPAADTAVTRQGQDIVFSVSRGAEKPPCIEDLDVTGVDHRFDKLWSIALPRDGACVSRIVYGRLPPGADQERPAPALAVGQAYIVSIRGTRLRAGERFIVSDRQGDLVDHGSR